MCHQQCLNALARRQVSKETITMVRTFLTERTMSVKVGGHKSTPLPVPGGSPQGSILANYLFCLTTEQFSEETDDQPLTTDEDDESYEAYAPPASEEPPLPELQPGTSLDEDKIRAWDFIFFRPLQRLEDTVLSERGNQEEIDDLFGIPPNWSEQNLAVQVCIDDTNCIEKVKQLNSVTLCL